MRPIISNVRLLLLAGALVSHPGLTLASNAAVAAPAVVPKTGNSNPVFQLVGYFKDSVVRTVDGSKEMWSNHGRCNDIRSKQKEHKEMLKKQWEFEEQGLTPAEMKRRLQTVNGGVTYDEFIFLTKGKEDRGKLMNMMFLMWGAPRLFPYSLMFYPDMLPSPFARMPNASGNESKLEKLSRQRSHAVINTLLALENEARAIPALAKMNIFGRKKQERNMEMIETLGKSVAKVMTNPGAKDNMGAQMILNTLDKELYTMEELTRGEKRLATVPKSIVLGLMTAINGPAPLTGVMPNFMRRGTVFAQLQKILEADKFLVEEKVNLDTLSTARLLEACNDRMIGGPGRTDEELRQGLAAWLELAVVNPNHRTQGTGENFNENLARTALMTYYSVEATRDSRCASYLPRLMFQGQLQQ
jgi:hypothetical protein